MVTLEIHIVQGTIKIASGQEEVFKARVVRFGSNQ